LNWKFQRQQLSLNERINPPQTPLFYVDHGSAQSRSTALGARRQRSFDEFLEQMRDVKVGALKRIFTLAEWSSRDLDAGAFNLGRAVGTRLFNVSSMHRGWESPSCREVDIGNT
jgi:hypothetical protein